MGFKIRQIEHNDVNFSEFSHILIHEESGHTIAGLKRGNGEVIVAYGCQNTPEEVKLIFEKYINGQLPELRPEPSLSYTDL